MAEVDVKFAQITPSAQTTDSSSKFVGVQGGASDLLYSLQQLAGGPFTSTVSAGNFLPIVGTAAAATPRGHTARWSDVTNVLDFGADPTGVHDSTAAIQAAVNALQPTSFGAAGKVYFPPGRYLVHQSTTGGPAIQLPSAFQVNASIVGSWSIGATVLTTASVNPNVNFDPQFIVNQASPPVAIGTVLSWVGTTLTLAAPGAIIASPSGTTPVTIGNSSGIILEGAGGYNSASISASPPFNGFMFDDFNPSTVNETSANPWIMRNLIISNNYAPAAIYKTSLRSAGGWALAASTLNVTTTSFGTFNTAGGQILFDNSIAANTVPFYLGFTTGTAAGPVISGIPTTTLTLGDTVLRNNKGGAQIASANSLTPGDTIIAVQGYFASGSFTGNAASSTPQTITMALSYPTQVNGGAGLDAGWYFVWDWTKLTGGVNPLPQIVGVVQIGTGIGPSGWSGNSLTLTMQSQINSVGTADLLVLTPISGAVRHVSGLYTSVVEACRLSGVIGLTFDAFAQSVGDIIIGGGPESFGGTVKNCSIGNTVTAVGIGSTGINNAALIENCDTSGCWIGARVFGSPAALLSGRSEVCTYGIVIGGAIRIPAGGNIAQSVLIANTECEGSVVGIVTDGAPGLNACLISSIFITANHNNSTYGIYLNSGANTTVQNVLCTSSSSFGAFWNPSYQGPGTPAGIFVGDQGAILSSPRLTFMDCTSLGGNVAYNSTNNYPCVGWRTSAIANKAQYINCNNPPATALFSALPIANTGLVGQLNNGSNTAVAGNFLTITSGSLSNSFSPGIGSGVTGTGIPANT